MHFYKFSIGDYRRRTGHLTPLEHGIYRMLLDTYYLEEKPLNPVEAILMRTHCVRSADEVQAFSNVLQDFFVATPEGFRNRQCDEVIAAFYEKSEKARASARARWDSPSCNANAKRTQSEGNAKGMLPITHNPLIKDSSANGASTSARFEDFWKFYPTKKNKKKSKEIWSRKKLDSKADTLINDLKERTAKDRGWKEGYIPLPSTYLNGERWEDAIDTTPSKNKFGKPEPKPSASHESFEARDKKQKAAELKQAQAAGFNSTAEYNSHLHKEQMKKFELGEDDG